MRWVWRILAIIGMGPVIGTILHYENLRRLVPLSPPKPEVECMLSRTAVDRDDINPDSILHHYAMVIRNLETYAEDRGVALNWETLKVGQAPAPDYFQPGKVIIEARAEAL